MKYDESGHLLGWTRRRDGSVEEFTAEGRLVIEQDEHGRPARARDVRYVSDAAAGHSLQQLPGEAEYRYEYFSAEDRRGRSAPIAAAPRSARAE